ncbi:glycosyl hydrolase family 8 [Hahella sp. HN01]|uniref:glycosyl hydrolase family 8 n=1 Tax=Hahella sp. HN01 TaxID=2847262 RepID=UPI001C1EE24C|nr:glycosyl hydrolase family 8 [Hahella sp. HN01]MBU6950982.1 cellulose binding domain-containing protein [Hahella sp. HN01]
MMPDTFRIAPLAARVILLSGLALSAQTALAGCADSTAKTTIAAADAVCQESLAQQAQAARPFPQALEFAGKIKPDHVSQAQMNAKVAQFYDYWKSAYVKPSNGNTPGGGYYVNMKGTGGDGNEITTSEAHGYGMMLFALMAGHDSEAKQYFDGMYNMYDKHRSTLNNHLMSWVIDASENTSKDSDSASDGDMDIAYALLLAHYQWGSDGAINYLQQAKRIINNGLKGDDVHRSSKRTMLGDWDDDQWTTRSSDWMTDHMHAYQKATGDAFWGEAADTAYGVIDKMTQNHASATGLMSDFVIDSNPRPAPPNFLEADTDDDFSWNACRYPLRIAIDAAHFGDARASAAMSKLMQWAVNATGGDPGGVMAGYKLNGEPLVGYSAMAFTAPMVAAASVTGHQSFLNQGWDLISGNRSDYYSDSINLLSMLFISGNWWSPVEGGGDDGGDNGGDDGGDDGDGGDNGGDDGGDGGDQDNPAQTTLRKTDDWGDGYCADVRVLNASDSDLVWSVSVPIEGQVYTAWSANWSQQGNALNASGVHWNRELGPRESTEFGFCANR